MKWLTECSAEALGKALRVVAPELSGCPVTVPVPDPAAKGDPLWWSSSTVVGERFIVKFAWSRPAALRLAHEIGVLTALAREPSVPYLPEVVASSTDPLLLITRLVAGRSLFEVISSIDRDRAGQQLACFLAALHHPAARQRTEAAVGKLTGPQLPPATTGTLRERFGTWARPDQRRIIMRWCDWVDAVLASPGPAVLVHGDLHGNNQVWDHDKLRLVVDLETAGAAEPEYDLRTVPGPAMGPGVELLTAVMRHYRQITGRQLSADRVMAWHLRTALGDALWRSEAGIPLADHRTPPDWVDDLAARFSMLGIDPEAPRVNNHEPSQVSVVPQSSDSPPVGHEKVILKIEVSEGHIEPLRRLNMGSCPSSEGCTGWAGRSGAWWQCDGS
jgi:aminoglycoside phosphotransferase (APT) family kinase protein